MPDTTNLNLLWTSLLIEELVRHGLTGFIVSPGSRSAPLTVAVARHPQIQALVAYDERAAAFFALGHARATGQPAVLICTSGSAAAHYLPAIVEAAQDNVPMLILTSDRPPELLETGANQAIRQSGLYGDYPRWAFDFPVPSLDIPPQWILSTVDQAVHRCLAPMPGPVHLNLPFREPLAPKAETIPESYLASLSVWLSGQAPYTHYHQPVSGVPDAPAELNHPGLLILGRLKPDEREGALLLAEALGWPVFADILSGLRLDARLSRQIPYYDQLLTAEAFSQLCRPQTVLQLGDGYVSGRLLKHLAAHPPQHYLQVLAGSGRQDPNQQVTARYQGDITAICRAWSQAVSRQAPANELAEWAHHAESVYRQALDASDSLSEPAVARVLIQALADGEQLMLGNSMAVREADSFVAPREQAPLIFGNRGTSGIDGHVACAAGLAMGSESPVTLLCGDLTLFHDLNSLHLLRRSVQPIRVIVVNNGGGGIFSFLPIAAHTDVFEPWFGTPHDFNFAGAAQMFGLSYYRPETMTDFKTTLKATQGQSALIEVVTRREDTLALHRHLQELLARS